MKLFNWFKKKKVIINKSDDIQNIKNILDLSDFGITNDWKNITLEFYLKYQNYCLSEKISDDLNDTEKGLRYLSYLEGKTYEEIKAMPQFLLAACSKKWEFLSDDYSKLELLEPFIEIEDKVYFITKDFNTLSLEQYQHIEYVLKQSEIDKNYLKNIHLLIGISCIPRLEYTFEKAEALSMKILEINMYNILPNISFFLFENKELLNNTLSYLRRIETKKLAEMEVIQNKLEILIKRGDGLSLLSKWQMKIYYYLIKYYTWSYKKYWSI